MTTPIADGTRRIPTPKTISYKRITGLLFALCVLQAVWIRYITEKADLGGMVVMVTPKSEKKKLRFEERADTDPPCDYAHLGNLISYDGSYIRCVATSADTFVWTYAFPALAREELLTGGGRMQSTTTAVPPGGCISAPR